MSRKGVLGIMVVLAAAGGAYYYLLRPIIRIVSIGCGDLPAYSRGFGYLNSQLFPIGTILVKDGSPKGITVLGYAAGRNPAGVPGAGGRDRKLELKTVVQGDIPWADAETRAGIEQAATRVAVFTARNVRGWSLPGTENLINHREQRRQIERHLQQRHAVAIVTTVLVADGLTLTTTTGEDATAGVNLGAFGRNRVTARLSCSGAGRMTGKNIPVAYDVTEIEDPGPLSPLRTRTAAPGAWSVQP